MDSQSIVAATAHRILADHCDPQTVNGAKTDAWKRPAWAALEDAGLPLAWVAEELGGSGASLAEGFEIVRAAGRFPAPLPLVETLLAGWLLSRAGLDCPRGPLSCGPTRDGQSLAMSAKGMLNGTLPAIPFAADAGHLALLARRDNGSLAVALVPAGAARIKAGTNLAGDARDSVAFSNTMPAAVKDAPEGLDQRTLAMMGAAVRAMQMAGALEGILAASVGYANERVAFERTIAKFQAVQHNLARLAGEVAVAIAAAGSAADAIANALTFDDGVLLEVAAAKIRVGEAAGEGAAIAHQVHGAIGFTREHSLHLYTRRLWAWRDDFGNESDWAARLGTLVAAKGADGLWPMLAAR
jgi:acyl-CoA dehydrogenase